ncbi:MAG: hypothetical protein H5U09_03325 [Desulfomicrobiaceae bacterium]|nr:hypothetical protein [Desulfomicrobiaceae bacterium]
MASDKILHYEKDQLAYMAGMSLQGLAECLYQRRFCNPETGQTVCVPKEVHVEWELKRKDSGKVKLEIEVTWTEGGNNSPEGA